MRKVMTHLELSVEMHTGLAVEIVAGSDVRFLVSSEGEHWKRNWDWNVDSDLEHVDGVNNYIQFKPVQLESHAGTFER